MAERRPVTNGQAAPQRGGLAGWQVRRVCALVEDSLSTLDAQVMAQAAKLSPSHFTRAFRRSMDMTPGAWLRGQRVERARALLDGTDQPVEAIARSVGYRGAPQLARAFKRQFGLAPSAYRKRE